MTRLSLRVLLQGGGESAVRECAQRWCANAPAAGRQAVADASASMENEGRVNERLAALPRRLQDLLEAFFADAGAVPHWLVTSVTR